MPKYELLDKKEKFIGEVHLKQRPHQEEVIEVEGRFYRWANVIYAFIHIDRPNSKEKANSTKENE